MLSALAFLAVGCIGEEFNNDIPSAECGDEVQFGLSLSNPETRTIYGVEDNNAFPIYWVNGDKVQVYSPECLTGRNQAEYQVAVDGATQNYATSLTKTGTTGVQWGNKASATFYSIYPSAGVTWSNDGTVTASMNIASTQSLTHTLVEGTYYATDMDNVVMYAKTTANRTDGTVNLKYWPYSTIIEFELNADMSQNADASIFVESLTFTSPNTNIAGDFDLKLGSTIGVTSPTNGSKSITLQFATQPELKTGSTTLKAKMCLIPRSDVASLAGWTVSVVAREGTTSGAYTYTIPTPKEGVTTSTALEAGKVHKIKLPKLTATKEWEYKPGAWMPELPGYETIYLTELSIPGAWYAGSKISQGYQNTTSFTELWNAGVRAFGAECRSYTPRTGFLGGGDISNDSPTRVCLSGNGSEHSGAYTHQWAQESAMIYISDIIKQIAGAVSDKNEFAVLVLSYSDGGSGGHRDLDYKYFMTGLQKEITESGATNIATQISQNTTIGDVKGKLIIKVNVDNRVDYSCSGVSAMYSAVPLIAGTNVTGGLDLSSVYYSDLINGSWIGQDATTEADSSYDYTAEPDITADSFLWCFTSANRTSTDAGNDIPTYEDREATLNAMMEKSREIYEASTHNVWFYFNCGGTQTTSSTEDGSGTDFATTMNTWLLDVINTKMNGKVDDVGNVISASDPSPLGIIMFNQCTNTDYSGPTIIRSIIEMNNKVVLKHRSTRSAAASYSSGMTGQNVSAIGWE